MKEQQGSLETPRPITIAMLVAAMALAGSSVVVGKLLMATLPVYLTTFLTLSVALFCLLPLMRGRFD